MSLQIRTVSSVFDMKIGVLTPSKDTDQNAWMRSWSESLWDARDFVCFVMLWLKLFQSGVGDDGDHFPEKVSLLSTSAVTAFHKA